MRKYTVRSYIAPYTCLILEYPVFCQNFASIFQDCFEIPIIKDIALGFEKKSKMHFQYFPLQGSEMEIMSI